MAQSQTVNVERLPNHMQDEARRYIEDGRHPGGFLRSVLTNDFAGAVGHADSANREYLPEWALWLCNDIPSQAWGSQEAVDEWVAGGGRSE